MKRVSLKMKTALKKAAYGTIALACVLTTVACANGSEGAGNTTAASYDNLPLEDDLNLIKLKGTTDFDGQSNKLKSGDKTLPFLSKKEIKDLLDKTSNSHWPENPYEIQPKTTAPYNTGKLKKEALQLGLNRLNVMRRLSGVPPVYLDKAKTEGSQIGALLMAINEKTAHSFGSAPAGMDAETFKKGNGALANGNLSNHNLIESVDSWQEDRNHALPMHRVWSLLPISAKVGMGYVEVEASNRAANRAWNGYTSLAACDQSAKPFDWDFVAWPAPGYFPISDEIFPSKHKVDGIKTNPWLIIFNRGKGSSVPIITLERTRNNSKDKTWKIQRTQDTSGSGAPVYKDEVKEGNISWSLQPAGQGAAAGMNIMAFLPEDADYKDGDVYKVTIQDGQSTNLKYEYEVKFFDPAQVK